MDATPFHFNCVVCQSVAKQLTGKEAALTLLAMLRDDTSPEEMHRDLCFAHRRIVEDVSRSMQAERGAVS